MDKAGAPEIGMKHYEGNVNVDIVDKKECQGLIKLTEHLLKPGVDFRIQRGQQTSTNLVLKQKPFRRSGGAIRNISG